MHKNFRITVDGRGYNVSVEDLDHGTARAEPTQLAAVVPVAPVVHAVVAAPAAPPVAAGANTIIAPLGGVVFSIDVPVGRVVAVGDRVVTIEAMKMKTEVLSKIAGTVVSIAARANESVETGQLLMTLE